MDQNDIDVDCNNEKQIHLYAVYIKKQAEEHTARYFVDVSYVRISYKTIRCEEYLTFTTKKKFNLGYLLDTYTTYKLSETI